MEEVHGIQMSPWAEEQWHFSAGMVVVASPVSASLTPHGVDFTLKPSEVEAILVITSVTVKFFLSLFVTYTFKHVIKAIPATAPDSTATDS